MTFARAKRRDTNEPEIVDALVAAGASVTRIDGDGVPDLLVGFKGRSFLLEVKLPLGARGGVTRHRKWEGGDGDMTRAQVTWWGAWKGEPAVVVRSPFEALCAIGASAMTLAEVETAMKVGRR
jgi:hypothetical protein